MKWKSGWLLLCWRSRSRSSSSSRSFSSSGRRAGPSRGISHELNEFNELNSLNSFNSWLILVSRFGTQRDSFHSEATPIRDHLRGLVLNPHLKSAKVQHRRIDFVRNLSAVVDPQTYGVVFGSVRPE